MTPHRSESLKKAVFGSALLYCLGVYLRFKFILHWHPATAQENLFSDALSYYNLAERMLSPAYVPHIVDTIYAPGPAYYFAMLRKIDFSGELFLWMQFALASLYPLIVAAIGLRLFGVHCAALALAFVSLYFPAWEYFGFLLSEGPFAFLLTLSFYFLVGALQSKSRAASSLSGFGAGVTLGVCCAFKSACLASAALVFAGLILLNRRHGIRIASVLGAGAIGLLLMLIPISLRATRSNEGNFLLVAHNDAPAFLLGHHGRVSWARYMDSQRRTFHSFANPSAAQRGYRQELNLHFGPYEAKPQYALAWRWIGEHPGEAFLQSIEHVFDLFSLSIPWPGATMPYVSWVIFFQGVFLVFILFPAAYYILRNRRELLTLDARLSGDILVGLVAFSIYLVAFVYIGEPRYRIPYDSFMILLACRALCKADQRFASFESGR